MYQFTAANYVLLLNNAKSEHNEYSFNTHSTKLLNDKRVSICYVYENPFKFACLQVTL